MPATKWSDFGNIWSTVRELDVSAIREEAERPLIIASVGHPTALSEIARLLRTGAQRYGPSATDPLELVPLDQSVARRSAFERANLLLLAIDARVALSDAEVRAFDQLENMHVPFLVVTMFGDKPNTAGAFSRVLASHAFSIADPATLEAPDQLGAAMLERLPAELHLAAARSLPGLRAPVARDLISSGAFSNATYSLASGLPEQIPIINVPFAAADMLVLTKNQALLVYRLALAHGAPPDFNARIREVVPVLGGAFLWRQAARSLIGLVPIWGLVPKVAIAYAGTYATGIAAWRWFAEGELVSTDQVKSITQNALAQGRARAGDIIARARQGRNGNKQLETDTSVAAQPSIDKPKPGFFARLKQRLPGQHPPDEPPPTT